MDREETEHQDGQGTGETISSGSSSCVVRTRYGQCATMLEKKDMDLPKVHTTPRI